MKWHLVSVIPSAGLWASISSGAFIPCESPHLVRATGVAGPGFSVQTRSGQFTQSSRHYFDGHRNLELFFLDFRPDPTLPYDSYSHDLVLTVTGSSVAFSTGESAEFDYGASISGVERIGMNGVVAEYFTGFNVALQLVYDGEQWSGTGNWEYYTLPLADLSLCRRPVPESGPGIAVLVGLLGFGWFARTRGSSCSLYSRGGKRSAPVGSTGTRKDKAPA